MSTTVDALHDLGRDALLKGRPTVDVAPSDGSRRWGLSVLARPQGDLADRLDAATAELVALAGPGQWASGSAGTAHLTLFSLEPHRPAVSLADPDARSYADATARAAAGRHEPLGVLPVEELELVRYEHRSDRAGARMVPVTLACAALTGVRAGVSDGSYA